MVNVPSSDPTHYLALVTDLLWTVVYEAKRPDAHLVFHTVRIILVQ
jgi:hypothetical protein